MQLDEFKRQVEMLGLKVTDDETGFSVRNGHSYLMAFVDKDIMYKMSLYEFIAGLPNKTQAKLQKIVYKFSRTPVAERKPEKKWYVRVPEEWDLGKYFKKHFGLTTIDCLSKNNPKVQFTMQEIKDYKLENFERVEVED